MHEAIPILCCRSTGKEAAICIEVMCVCVRVPDVSYIGFGRSTSTDGCVYACMSLMSVTSASASRFRQMGVCMRACP